VSLALSFANRYHVNLPAAHTHVSLGFTVSSGLLGGSYLVYLGIVRGNRTKERKRANDLLAARFHHGRTRNKPLIQVSRFHIRNSASSVPAYQFNNAVLSLKVTGR